MKQRQNGSEHASDPQDRSARYRLVAELSSDYAYSFKVNRDGKLEPEWVEGAFARITGYTPDGLELAGGWGKLIHPDDEDTVREQRETLISGRPSTMEYRIVTRGGHVRWVRDFAAPVSRSIEGRVTRVVGAVKDVTEQREALIALREERDRAQKYLDVAGVMLVALDRDGTITMMNRRGCEIVGCGERDLTGKNWFDACIPERLREEVEGVHERIVSGELEPVEYYENPVVNRSGEERLISWHNVTFTDDEGRVTGTLSSGNDITEERATLDALRESEEQYRGTIDAMSDAIHVVDKELRIVLVNSAFDEWLDRLGLPREVTGRTVREAFPFVPKEVEAEYRRVFEQARIVTTKETTEVHGRAVVTETRKIPVIEHGSVARVLTVIRDISDETRTHERLEALLQSVPGVVLYQTGGGVEYISESVEALLGFPAEEFREDRGKFPSLIHPDDRESVDEEFAQWLRDGCNGIHTKEFRVKHREGHWVRVRDRTRLAFRTPDGRHSTLGVLIDITAQKGDQESAG